MAELESGEDTIWIRGTMAPPELAAHAARLSSPFPCMANIGQRNLLPILRSAPPGYYLDGGGHGEILLPGRYIPKGVIPGGIMDVFVYRDSEDRLVATTETPHAMVGQFALLRVVSVNPRIGVFLDWGLEKDLLLPIREQTRPLNSGDWIAWLCLCLVIIC